MNIKYLPLKRITSAWNAHTNVATARKMPCLVSCAIRCLESAKTPDRERIKLSATLSQCDLRTGDWLRKSGQPGWLKWLQWVNLTSLSRLGRSNTDRRRDGHNHLHIFTLLFTICAQNKPKCDQWLLLCLQNIQPMIMLLLNPGLRAGLV